MSLILTKRIQTDYSRSKVPYRWNVVEPMSWTLISIECRRIEQFSIERQKSEQRSTIRIGESYPIAVAIVGSFWSMNRPDASFLFAVAHIRTFASIVRPRNFLVLNCWFDVIDKGLLEVGVGGKERDCLLFTFYCDNLGWYSPSSTITVFSTSRVFDWESASQRP